MTAKFFSASALFVAMAALAAAANPTTVRAVLKSPKDRKPAPSFALKNASGKTVSLKNYRGKVVLLDFWATTCGGCKLEIPWYMQFDRTYKSQGLQVVGVSMDILYERLKDANEAWSRVNPFVDTHQVKYAILMGDDRVTKSYQIDAMPATYLIDSKGRIAATYVGVVDRANIEANIKTLLKQRR